MCDNSVKFYNELSFTVNYSTVILFFFLEILSNIYLIFFNLMLINILLWSLMLFSFFV